MSRVITMLAALMTLEVPPKVPPTASISIALSTSDSAVRPKQCSFQ